MKSLGIDIGGSGIKGAPVDLETGEQLGERYRIETPQDAGATGILDTISAVVQHFDWKGPIGCGYPGVIKDQVIRTSANLPKDMIGIHLADEIQQRTGNEAWVINDADAAGLAEATFGAGKGHPGVIIVVTVGTGLGTAMLVDGRLVPNTEFGHLRMLDKKTGELLDAECIASGSARSRLDLGWGDFGKRLNRYLKYVHELFWPDLIIIGGGISKKGEKFLKHLDPGCEEVTAEHQNTAGIVGAGMAALQLPEVAAKP